MPPTPKSNAMEEQEQERRWLDHNASSNFIDIDISLDAVSSKRDGRRSSLSGRSSANGSGNEKSWAEGNELQNYLLIEIGDRSFHLPKSLVSKSGMLHRMVLELRGAKKDRISLKDVPGGAEAFENVVRFLYGQNVPITSSNVASLRCAVDFLEINDGLGERGLVAKTENYLNHIVLGSWKDSITVLCSCSKLEPWAEELEIVRRCSESVAWKASTDPHGLRWSYTKSTGSRDAPRGWWFDDVCILHIDMFSKVINAVVAKGMDYTMVAAAIMQYAEKWLGLTKDAQQPVQEESPKPHSQSHSSIAAFAGFSQDISSKAQMKKRAIFQGIVKLIPSQPDSVSCKFLLKLLRTACAVNAGPMFKTDLVKRIGTQLENVTVAELLIPAYSASSDAMYDIDVVCQIVECYLQEQSFGSPPMSPTSSAGNSITSSVTSGSDTTSLSSVTTSSSGRSVSGSSGSDSSVTDTSSVSERSIVSRTSISSSGLSISGSSNSGSGISGSSVSGSSVSGSSISGKSFSDSSISDTSVSGSSVSGSSVSGSSVTGSTITITSVSGSGTSLSRSLASISDTSSSSDESTSTETDSDESVKLDSMFESKKFFSTEGPTRRPQLPPTSANLKVSQVLEVYLEEVAKDSSIPLGKFVAFADLFIEFPRVSDDCVYSAIDTFLKSHPNLNDLERRKLCKVMDIQALSLNACMHAATNERLPLRVVVQILFTEQVKLRNAITATAVINEKRVESIPPRFSSSSSSTSSSTDSYSESSSSDPLSSSTASTDTSTTSLSTSSASSASSAYSLSIHSVQSVHSDAPSVAPSVVPSVVSSVMPGGFSVKDTLRGALSEIELLRAAVQEIEFVKARLGFIDVLQQEMENMNRKFLDLAHDYTGMTHQVEELTKASKHKSGWTSGWKKMSKPFSSKETSDLQKGYNHTLVSERHLKAAVDSIPLYPHMNTVQNSADVQLLQNPRTPGMQSLLQNSRAPAVQPLLQNPRMAAAQLLHHNPRAPVQPLLPSPRTTVQAAKGGSTETPRSNSGSNRIPEAKVDGKVIVLPKAESSKGEHVPQIQTAPEGLLKVMGVLDQPNSKDKPPQAQSVTHSVSSSKAEKSGPSESSEVQKDENSSLKQRKSTNPDLRHGHQSRSQHRASTPPPDSHHSRHSVKESDAVSVSSDRTHSSTRSNPRHRHRNTSSGHRHRHRDGSEDPHSHRGSSHGRSGHGSHHRHRDGSSEHRSSSHHRDRSSDDHHGRSHHSPHHHHSKDPPRQSLSGSHKHGSDHHSGHHSHHRNPHRRSHQKHHHRKDYDTGSSYSSDSVSRPTRNRRHS